MEKYFVAGWGAVTLGVNFFSWFVQAPICFVQRNSTKFLAKATYAYIPVCRSFYDGSHGEEREGPAFHFNFAPSL